MQKKLLAFIAVWLLFFTGCTGTGSSKSLRVGIDPSFIPLNTMGQESNLYGYAQELLGQIGRNTKENIELLKLSWDDLLPQLRSGKLDAIITTISPYNFYKKEFVFSEPIIKTGPCLISTKSVSYKTLEALDNKIIGIISASSSEAYISEDSTALIQSFDNPSSLLDALVRGQIDAAFLDYLIAYAYTIDLYQNQLNITSAPYGDAGLRFMMKKAHAQSQKLIDATNAIIDDTSANLLKKWKLPKDN